MDPSDHMVLEYIRKYHLFPPENLPYAFDSPIEQLDGQSPQGLPIAEVTNFKKNGFFIECGANDGEFFANTLGLEIGSSWTGLLIEASPNLFQKMKRKHRKAWLSDVCLSGEIERIEFLKSTLNDNPWRVGQGKINPGRKYKLPAYLGEPIDLNRHEVEGVVECFPLQSILWAMNLKTVDFFSLDVEGHEYQILKDFPFQSFDIKVLAVEHWVAVEGKEAIRSLLLSNGYHLQFESESDFIFVKNKIK
ncbi:uncharacterized protein LOC110855736 [Folsomia candida]|uniref:uncharacterized protein LOC110855736 n=1 Tax=Folsomia candida TaxID=158441 RepID=UPI000B908490|nr:uncharacterized protein LOC110855736 [Folsomia candida]